MSYHHFTITDRITIKSYLRLGMSQTDIANAMGVNKGSISRELGRNMLGTDYEPIQAHNQYLERKKHCHKPSKMTTKVKQYIEERILECTWSPEQIVGRNEEKPANFPATAATIYNWIHKGYLLDGDMTKLRRKGNLTKTIEEKKRCKIDIGKSIRKRPKSVYARQTIGDWEGDTVHGKQGTKACFVTLLERKSRYYLAELLPNRKSEVVSDSIVNLLSNIPDKVRRTITFDRGREFAGWRTIERRLGCETYFADPFCAWQKGSNENTNGLLREFFPKGTDLSHATSEQVTRALHLLNNRPRKCLNYQTPNEVFYGETPQNPKRL